MTATDTRGESRDVFGGGGARGEGDARVREAASSTIVEASREGRPDAPGVRSYLWGVRRRVIEMWRPGVVRVPNLAETLMSSFVSPERALRMFGQRFMERQREAVEMSERVAGASDAIEAIGGVAGRGPDQRHAPRDAFNESWRRNVRITRAEVEVEQTETGAVRAVRVVRSSNIGGFDRAAVEAVRAALDELDPVPLPGGRRSRWSFTVLATRNLITPNVGGEFDESRGWFSIQLPGQVRLRSRVRMESSAALEAN
ncbi:MAG: TonB family protein [Polyangiales bacterium]